jgi:predicted permease
MDRLVQDFRQATRRLRRTPAFTAATIATLALTIGANASIFAVVHRVILNPLPYEDSGRLVALLFGMPARNVPPSGIITISSRLYYQYLDRATTIDDAALYRTDEATLTGRGEPERIVLARTTPSLGSLLRVSPVAGRWFTDAEGEPGAPQVAVLSYDLWVSRYGQNAGVVGEVLRLDGVPTTIVGVMPATFRFPDPLVDLWVPLPLNRAAATDPGLFSGVARLRDGATVAQARTELTRLSVELEPLYPNSGYSQLVSSATVLLETMVGHLTSTLWTLLASAGLLLILACANVTNLFLVRSEAREREVAIRNALGAGGSAMARYFLTESTLLALAGGAIGLGLAWGAIRLLLAYGPANLPRLTEIRLDAVIVAFTLALSLFTAVVFGVIQIARRTFAPDSLREGWTPTASRRRFRTQHALMGSQIALALVLIVASGLTLRSFQRLRAVDPGFDPRSALTFRIGFPRSAYPTPERLAMTHRAILEQLSALPGVTAASASTCLPLSEQQLCQGGALLIEGRVLPPNTPPPFVAIRGVAERYFETMGMRVIRGSGLDQAALEREEPVVVINEALAQRFFPREDPVGRRVRLGGLGRPANPPAPPAWLTVVGVVSSTPTFGLSEANPFPQLFMPMFAARAMGVTARLDTMNYVMRSSVTPATLAMPASRAVARVDPELALAYVRTLQDIVDRAAAQMAFTMVLLVIAAAIGLTIGVIGIYGITSYIVTQRFVEIGVRLALGATPTSVARQFVRQGGIVALSGIVIGLALAYAGTRLIASLLFGVSPRDPVVFGLAALVLFSTALFGCWLPAHWGSRLNPVKALRKV